MLTGRLLTESLRVGADLSIPGPARYSPRQNDVSSSTTPEDSAVDVDGDQPGGATNAQPQVWTFLDFEAPDERAEELAEALAAALDTVTGWWADFIVGEEHVVVFANRVFRYRIGDHKGRDEAVAWDVPLGPPSTSSTGANSSFRRLGETGTSGPGRPPAQRSARGTAAGQFLVRLSRHCQLTDLKTSP
jgi:hypothetical protein